MNQIEKDKINDGDKYKSHKVLDFSNGIENTENKEKNIIINKSILINKSLKVIQN